MFIGDFKDGEISVGKIKCKDFTYEGEIKNRMPNGKGIKIIPYGNKIQGFFKDGKAHGFISESSSTGVHKWEGIYFEGKRNGLFRKYWHGGLFMEI